jgi:hypothetical protein
MLPLNMENGCPEVMSRPHKKSHLDRVRSFVNPVCPLHATVTWMDAASLLRCLYAPGLYSFLELSGEDVGLPRISLGTDGHVLNARQLVL